MDTYAIHRDGQLAHNLDLLHPQYSRPPSDSTYDKCERSELGEDSGSVRYVLVASVEDHQRDVSPCRDHVRRRGPAGPPLAVLSGAASVRNTQQPIAALILMLLVIFHNATLVQGQLGCVWRSSISATLPEIQEISLDPSCNQGQLWWYNPHGALRAIFRMEAQDTDFRLCVACLAGFQLLTAVSMETHAGLVALPLPQNTEDRLCVSSTSGRAIIIMEVRSKVTEVANRTERTTVIEYQKMPP